MTDPFPKDKLVKPLKLDKYNFYPKDADVLVYPEIRY
jgi:hypothetical protein